MALLIPTLGSCSASMTPGERRVAERLLEFLEEQTLIWYEPPISKQCLEPDFVLLHPDKGLLVLEVKDWKIDNLESIDPYRARLKEPAVEVANPLQQVRHYAQAIDSLLKTDGLLVRQPDRPHAGKLVFPYGYGVVLANILRSQFEQAGLGDAIEPHHVICRDEIYASVDRNAFRQRLWSFPHYSFGQRLSEEQVDRIRWHLFPDIRLERQLTLSLDVEEAEEDRNPLSSQQVLHMMDLQQEQLARSLGEGHRVIHGVAGSGKTAILLCRAEQLAKRVDGPILVLCFNVGLASKLKHTLTSKGLGQQVTVCSFHQWCREMLVRYRLPLPEARSDGGDYAKALFERVRAGVEGGDIPVGQFDSIAIDEVHDFEPEWLQLLVEQVSDRTQSLLLLYDDAQKLYGDKRHRFSFKSVGVRAIGRTSILRLNYRNTREILQFAFEFARASMGEQGSLDADEPICYRFAMAKLQTGKC